MKRTESVSNNKSLALKDYLETASDASRRTRFITIVMLVASVLVGASVLNSWDKGWITLRLEALRHTTSPYTIRRFPLLCECDKQLKTDLVAAETCKTLMDEDTDKETKRLKTGSLFWKVNEINNQLKALDIFAPYGLDTTRTKTTREKLEAAKEKLCKEEYEKLSSFYNTMERAAAEVKYTVRVPFFVIAFDVNDTGILGGLSLWIILILLRLSLRQQIISLRIGFKEAFACDQEKDFYQILASRQVFVFPYLSDPRQSARVSWGWIELGWSASKYSDWYHGLRERLVGRFRTLREDLLTRYNIRDASESYKFKLEAEKKASTSNVGDEDGWQANRNFSLRFVPKMLSLVPFFIYLFQYIFDALTSHYGFELSEFRTYSLLFLGALFLLNLLVFGIWCITKWNELDRLWDYYYDHMTSGTKPGEITTQGERHFDVVTEVKQADSNKVSEGGAATDAPAPKATPPPAEDADA